jgi:uncharacterized protein YceK
MVGLVLALIAGSGLSGCATAVIAGAAAAGGYIAHEKGYRVRNPIVRKRDTR